MSVASKKKKIFDGRYEVLSIVGRGACSVVYHAKNITSPSSEVALKVLINQQGGTSSTDRLRKEALAMVSSRHKYVIRLDDFHSVQDLCYLSMEYAKEGDLRKYSIKLGGKLPVQQSVDFFKQTAEALNFVHRVGITHRDIKPDNILVLNDREIRLTDFGVAVLPGEQASLDDLQQGVGTMSYMAPEVLEGKACDKLSDIYALGLSFYEMLCGVHPFENAPLVKQLDVRADNNLTHISKLVPNLPDKTAEIIMRCLRYKPDQRFLSMNDLLKAFNSTEEAGGSNPSQAAKPATAVNKAASEKRSPRIATKIKTKNKASQTKPPIAEIKSESVENKGVDKSLEDEIDDILNELEENDSDTSTKKSSSTAAEMHKPDQSKFESDILDEEDDDDIDLEDYQDEDPAVDSEEQASNYLEDPRTNTRPVQKKPILEQSYQSPDKSQKSSFLNTLLVAGLILYVSNYLLYKVSGYKIFGSSEEYTAEVTDDSSYLINKSSAPIASFPNLPAGMYHGNIYDIIPGEESKLIVISMPEQDSLIFILGVEGWTPSMSPISKAKQNSIRVSSNGIVLDMEADIVDGSLHGIYRNALNGTKGKWQLKPFK